MKKIGKIIFFNILLVLIILIVFILYVQKNAIVVLRYPNIGTIVEIHNFSSKKDWIISADKFKEHLDFLKR